MALKPILSLLVVAAVFAGCADSGEAPVVDDFQIEDELEATPDTGIIRGVVVDASIKPVVGANVSIGEQWTETDENGAFGFDKLQPGTYFVEVSKLGFLPVQQSVDVVAGDAEPPIMKVLMEIDGSFNPYYMEQSMQGFIECTSSHLVLCGAPDLLKCILFDLCDPITNDRYTPTVGYDQNPTWVQTEIAWQSTQPLGESLYLEVETEANTDYITGSEGASPVMIAINETTLEEHQIGGEGNGIYYSIFSGYFMSQEVPDPVTGGSRTVGAGATFQQEVSFFFHSFYGYEPGDWRFTSGEPVPTVS